MTLPPTVFPLKMQKLTLAMIEAGGQPPWHQQLENIDHGSGYNAATLLHLFDAYHFGIDPAGGELTPFLRNESFRLLDEHLIITYDSDQGRRFWQRWTDPKFHRLSKLRDGLRRANTPDDFYNELEAQSAAEAYFSYVPDDIEQRWHEQGRP